MGPWCPSDCPGQIWQGVGWVDEDPAPAPHDQTYHTATATIFMTDSLRHWQKLTRGAPLSPMRPSMMPAGGGRGTQHITDAADQDADMPTPMHAGGPAGTSCGMHRSQRLAGFPAAFDAPAPPLHFSSPPQPPGWSEGSDLPTGLSSNLL